MKGKHRGHRPTLDELLRDAPCGSCQKGYGKFHSCDVPDHCSCDARHVVVNDLLGRLALAVLVVALLVLGLPLRAEAAGGVYMVGDSITYRGTDNLRSLGVHWTVDAVPGRPATPLAGLIAARMAQGAPRVLIVALGTNIDATRPYTEEDYRAAIAQVPASTKVVLVTPYRDPNRYDPSVWSPSTPYTAAAVAAMMTRIAADRPHTCIAPWARFASRHRSLLVDGIHPTGPAPDHGWGAQHFGSRGAGQQAWARLVVRAVRGCS